MTTASAAMAAAAASPTPGPIVFARYAFGPNRLGYCGPDDAAQLFGEATRGGDVRTVRRLAEQFEGAYPYLRLIARANGLADPLDARVVDAYWIGNPMLRAVRPSDLGESLDVRFRRRLRGDQWRWLATKPADGALPMHAFHVLDVFPRVGLLRSGQADDVLTVIDSCRIRWGRVMERDGDHLVVNAVPLEMKEGQLSVAPPRVERIRAWQDGAGFFGDAAVGDVVSIHWDWACEKLSATRLRALQRWTAFEIEVANHTI